MALNILSFNTLCLGSREFPRFGKLDYLNFNISYVLVQECHSAIIASIKINFNTSYVLVQVLRFFSFLFLFYISIHHMSWFKEDDLGISKTYFPFNWFFKEVFQTIILKQ